MSNGRTNETTKPICVITRGDLDRLSRQGDRAIARLNRAWFWYRLRQKLAGFLFGRNADV